MHPDKNEWMDSNQNCVEKDDDVLIDTKIKDIHSSDRFIRMQSLRFFSSLLPKLDNASILSIFKNKGLAKLLLHIIASDNAEICRENSTILSHLTIKALNKNIMTKKNQNGNDNEFEINEKKGVLFMKDVHAYRQFLEQYWIDFCPMFYQRFFSSSEGFPSLSFGNQNIVRKASEEPAEEIRLILAKLVYDLVCSFIVLGQIQVSFSKHETNQSQSAFNSNLTRATALLVQALYRSVLLDPYPDLKREGCNIILQLCKQYPVVIKMHSEALLRPLCGNSVLATDATPLPTKNSQMPLIRHRHAKIRLLALETSASILETFKSKSNVQKASQLDDIEVIDNVIIPQSSTLEYSNDSYGNECDTIINAFIIPGWDQCSCDKSSSVRMALINAVGKVLKFDSNKESSSLQASTTSRLIIFLLDGISSESIEISKSAHQVLEEISLLYTNSSQNAGMVSLNEDITCSMVAVTVQSHFPFILPILSHYVMDWSLDRKLQGLRTLKITLELVFKSNGKSKIITSDDGEQCFSLSSLQVEKIISALSLALMYDDAMVKRAATSCAEMIGKSDSAIKYSCSLILPSIRGEVTHSSITNHKPIFPLSSPEQFSTALSLLGSILKGAAESCTITGSKGKSEGRIIDESSFVRELLGTLACRSVLDLANDQNVMWSLLHCCKSFVLWVPPSILFPEGTVQQQEHLLKGALKDQQQLPIIHFLLCCIQMLGCHDSFELKQEVLDILDFLSQKNPNKNDKFDIFQMYFRDLMNQLFLNDSKLSKVDSSCKDKSKQELQNVKTPSFRAFSALLEYSSGATVGDNFDIIAPIFEEHLVSSFPDVADRKSLPGKEHEEKLHMMALLESTISDPTFPAHLLHPFATQLIDSTIIPNMVWKAGGMSSALRKLSVAVLFSMLRGKLASPKTLFETASRLLPVMKSNLADDDLATRQLTCLSAAMIFEHMPCPLGEESVLQLYPSLLKTLDDSSENVRFAACDALANFMQAAPPSHFQCGVYSNIVEQLLIHMDDPDHRIQEAVFKVLRDSIEIDKLTLIKRVQDAKLSHRSSEFCDLLLDKAMEA